MSTSINKPDIDVFADHAEQDRTVHLYDNKGFVTLTDMMPRIVPFGRTADIAIARNARVSYAEKEKTAKEDNTLIRYLLENRHTSPFESIVFQFRIRCPIFVERQLVRHRTARLNEQSFRYIQPKEDFYHPPLRMQSVNNKQGSDETKINEISKESLELWNYMQDEYHLAYKNYDTLVKSGIAREVARTVLPVSLMTEMMWQMDLNNLMKFLQLRMDHHAQLEIRDLATGIYNLINMYIPDTIKAFNDFYLENITFSAAEIRHMNNPTDNPLPLHKKSILHNKINKCGITNKQD